MIQYQAMCYSPSGMQPILTAIIARSRGKKRAEAIRQWIGCRALELDGVERAEFDAVLHLSDEAVIQATKEAQAKFQ